MKRHQDVTIDIGYKKAKTRKYKSIIALWENMAYNPECDEYT